MAELALVLVAVVVMLAIALAGARRHPSPKRTMAGVAEVNEALARASDAARRRDP
ncbi:MAG: hypothetical protein QOG64_1259 [Acidimicrobiaceae bacterium]|nr:hypothetical protein [Acidimicrobiaceae bacterium]